MMPLYKSATIELIATGLVVLSAQLFFFGTENINKSGLNTEIPSAA